MDFAAWKAATAAVLGHRHGINASSIPERVWRRLYAGKHTPHNAAKRVAAAHRQSVAAKPPTAADDRARRPTNWPF